MEEIKKDGLFRINLHWSAAYGHCHAGNCAGWKAVFQRK